MAKKQNRKSGGARKVGRNSTKCALYRALGKRTKARKARITKHLELHPNDSSAKETLNRL